MTGKKANSFFLFIVFFVFLGAHCYGAEGPRLVIDEKFYDAGTILEGDIVEHSFKVFNKGDQALNITKVKPG